MNNAKTVLIAEDQQGIRDSMAQRLRRRNWLVLVAENRGVALDLLSKNRGQIRRLVTDLRMPCEGDGEVVARAALEQGMEVIVFSASPEDLTDEVRARCFAIFHKPEEREDLIALFETPGESLKKLVE